MGVQLTSGREHRPWLSGGSAEPFPQGWEKGGAPAPHRHHAPANLAIIPLITEQLSP